MTVTCLAFSGVIAEDGLDTQELSVGPTAPIAGKADADLSGAPAGSTKIAAFDLTITATADMAGAGSALAVAVSEEASLTPLPPGTNPLSGTWTGGVSPGDGQYRTSTVDARYSDNFSTWLTEYLTHGTSASSTNTVVQSPSAAFLPSELDVRFRIRRASYGSGSAFGTIVCTSGVAWEVRADGGGNLQAWVRTADAPNAQKLSTIAVGTLGVTAGAWSWGRVTYDQTSHAIRWWSSSDGVSWTLVQTNTFPGSTGIVSAFGSTTATLRIGNGQHASGVYASGFGGDIAFIELRGSVGGAVITDLNLAAMASSLTNPWNSTTAIANIRGASVTVHGGFVGTETFHFVFDTPTRLDEFRVYVEALHGAVSIDQWCLDYITDDGWSVGFLKF